MLKLVCLAAFVIVGLSLSMGIARLAASVSQQAGWIAEPFTNPDGSPCQRPCLLGVRPGMSWSDAWATLRAHPFSYPRQISRIVNRKAMVLGPEMTVSLQATYEESVMQPLASVDLASSADIQGERPGHEHRVVPLGAILIALGQPDSVYIDLHQVWLLYFNKQLLVTISRGRPGHDDLTVDSVVSRIALTGEPGGFRLLGQGVPWLGFSTIKRYEGYGQAFYHTLLDYSVSTDSSD